jgi:hypothetical protein
MTPFVKVYFGEKDADVQNMLEEINEKTRMSKSLITLLVLREGLPRMKESLKAFEVPSDAYQVKRVSKRKALAKSTKS